MVEKVAYVVVKKIVNVEVREYPELLLATVEGFDENVAFGLLFDFISGGNMSMRKIAMTAPVISSEKIPMTAPVISRGNYMAFVMPSAYDRETIPQPKNQKVQIEVVPKRTVAVLRFSGYATDKKTAERVGQLFAVVKKNNLKTHGEPFLMRYNSPFAPGFIRRNEVGIEIR